MELRSFILLFTLFSSFAAFTLENLPTSSNESGSLIFPHNSDACHCKNGRCVKDNRGKTKCNCKKGYALQDENTCESCDCGSKGKCIFVGLSKATGGYWYMKKCLCDLGSVENNGICVDCHCGENSNCEFEDGEKSCFCIDGYAEKAGVCTKCDCGDDGACTFQNELKVCTCDVGYEEINGYCTHKCENYRCQNGGTCQLQNGKPVCKCLEKYSGTHCEIECDCGEDGVCMFQNGRKICSCDVGYEEINGYCTNKCEKYKCQNGGTCQLKNGKPVCKCLEKYSGTHCEIGPPVPTGLKLIRVSNTTAEFQWEAPTIFREPFKGYRVQWKRWMSSGIAGTVVSGTSYRVTLLSPYEDYMFRVAVLTSKWNEEEWSEWLKFKTEVGVPHAPRNLTVTQMTDSTAELKWYEPLKSTGPIIGYRVYWQNSISEGEEDTKSTATYYTLRNLISNIKYTFKVLALTTAGPGQWSNQVTGRTKIQNKCSLIRCENGGKCQIINGRAICNCPDKYTGDSCEIDKCSLIRCLNGGKCDIKNQKAVCVCNGNFTGDFCEENKCENYKCQNGGTCHLRNEKPVCICSEKYLGSHCEIAPPVPTGLKVIRVSNTTAEFQWEAPTVFQEPFQGYSVEWKRWMSSGTSGGLASGTSYRATRLSPCKDYMFRVAVLTSKGYNGEWSQWLKFKTEVGVPHPPRTLTVTQMTNSTAGLKWYEPLKFTGPIIGYRVYWQNLISEGEEDTKSTETYYTLRNLISNMKYTFKVLALTTAGPGQWSKQTTGRTKIADKCSLIICLNGGKCDIKNQKAVCVCNGNFTGDFCEKRIHSTKPLIEKGIGNK